jgi:single-stranded-DNA-specific exonuclease
MNNKLWICNEVSEEKVEMISKQAQVSPLLAKILLSRGFDDIEKIKEFLNPAFTCLYEPFLLKDMDKAVDRIIKSIEENEKIVIYGDYDVDGVTSTAVLYDFLTRLNVNVDYYIPDRIEEGYGLSKGAIDKVIKLGASLIITVDCGVTAVDEVEYINDFGINIIITDHHKCTDDLPKAFAVVDPCRHDCMYPFKQLAGVGVAYKLVTAICMKMNLGEMYLDYLELVTLGTVADVVPLIEENRVIVKHGLKRIEKTVNLGLRTLIENSGLKDKEMAAWVISFVLAPRINAAGRIGDAARAVKLFTTKNPEEALSISQELNDENKNRQDTEQSILQEVISIIESKVDLKKEKVIVVNGEGWHHGIIGIVASKVTERYYRPCILISSEGGIGKGSGRSIEGFDLFKALNYCSRILEKYGGHELAAGVSLKDENICEFRSLINQYADEVLTEYHLTPKVKIDVALNTEDINNETVKKLDLLGPFGAGNPAPILLYNHVGIKEIRTVGDKKHLKLKVQEQNLVIDAIGFNMGNLIETYKELDIIDVVCSLDINIWNSVEKVQLNLRDLRYNNESNLKKAYFHSLDKCFNFFDTNSQSDIDNSFAGFTTINKEEKIIQLLENQTRSGMTAACYTNDLYAALHLEEIIRKSTIGIKKHIEVCYTSFNTNKIDIIPIIVNPVPSELGIFDTAIFYGPWLHQAYLKELLDRVGRNISFICHGHTKSALNIGGIIPDRYDLVAVYQYFKVNSDGVLRINDISKVAEVIGNSYRVDMNYFKLKKSIQIFQELKLLTTEAIDENTLSINISRNIKEKTNLNKSKLFLDLQKLKDQYKEATDF